MNEIFKTAIIGGGASGLLCAVELLRGKNPLRGEEIVILERCDRVGKKLIATGNGQGNLTNASLTSDNYYGDKNFIRIFLSEAENTDLEEYFYSLGIPMTTVNGKKYPVSRQANSVLDTIRFYLYDKNVNILTNFYAERVTKLDDCFEIVSGERKIYAEKAVIAVGGAAGKQFGTDGSSYALAEKFGHEKTKLYPSLVQIKTETALIRGLKGIKEQASVTAIDGNRILKKAVGEVLFTDYGVSGNAIFQISGHLAKAKNPFVKIEFLPEFTESETERIVSDRLKNAPHVPPEDALSCILAKRVGQTVLKIAADRSPKAIARAVKNFDLKVIGTLGFDYAQVTKGGIETKSINPYTYESKLVRGAYFTGEMLDIDGDCGGYNLTFAFVSGILAAKAVKNTFNQKEQI